MYYRGRDKYWVFLEQEVSLTFCLKIWSSYIRMGSENCHDLTKRQNVVPLASDFEAGLWWKSVWEKLSVTISVTTFLHMKCELFGLVKVDKVCLVKQLTSAVGSIIHQSNWNNILQTGSWKIVLAACRMLTGGAAGSLDVNALVCIMFLCLSCC